MGLQAGQVYQVPADVVKGVAEGMLRIMRSPTGFVVDQYQGLYPLMQAAQLWHIAYGVGRIPGKLVMVAAQLAVFARGGSRKLFHVQPYEGDWWVKDVGLPRYPEDWVLRVEEAISSRTKGHPV